VIDIPLATLQRIFIFTDLTIQAEFTAHDQACEESFHLISLGALRLALKVF
jgi:hypothetical protein